MQLLLALGNYHLLYLLYLLAVKRVVEKPHLLYTHLYLWFIVEHKSFIIDKMEMHIQQVLTDAL